MVAVVRERLRRVVAKWATRAVFYLSDTPEVPPKGSVFLVHQLHPGVSTHWVNIGWFTDARGWFQCGFIVEDSYNWAMVNVGASDLMVLTAAPHEKGAVAWLTDVGGVDYVACVPICGLREQRKGGNLIEPMACTTMAKRAIGLHDRRVLTPEELLAALWKRREV